MIVMEKLGDLLLAKEEISHSDPFDWRTKKPIIWRAVPQWFASVSKWGGFVVASDTERALV